MKRSTLSILKAAISILILAVLFFRVGITHIFSTLRHISLPYYPLIFFVYFFSMLVSAINISVLLRALGKHVNLFLLLQYSILSWGIGILTPGNIGDFSLAFLLKKHDVTLGQGTAIVFIDKVITVLILSLTALIGFFIFFGLSYLVLFPLFVFVAFLGGLCCILFFPSLRHLVARFIPQKYAMALQGLIATIMLMLRSKKLYLVANALFTILKWILSSLVIFLIFLSLHVTANLIYIYIFFITMTLTLFNLIPITYHGIGLKEAAGIYLYGLKGISPDVVLSAYLVLHFISYSISFFAVLTLLDHFKKPVI